MKSIRLFTFLSLLLFASNVSFSQNEEVNDKTHIENDKPSASSDSDLSNVDASESDSTPNTTKLNFVPIPKKQRPSDKTFRKYLELNKKETRFDLNFTPVAQYDYASNKKSNLSIMKEKIPIYNRYSYNGLSFPQSFVLEMALGLLGKRYSTPTSF